MHNSPNGDQNKQDQRKKTDMEDSSRMTVEFLRARLQSERSVSKTARQRADELAKRVVELEEQLKAVTLQRMKAEKATAEIVAVLEKHGFSDFSEQFDSSSDQEELLSESKEGNESPNKLESSVISKARMNKLEEFSGLELGGSPESGRSLSWKSCTDSPTSLKSEDMDQARRKRSSFISSGGSSSRRNLGKSCLQIRRKEMRSGADEARGESFQRDGQRSGEFKRVGVTSNGSKDRPVETTEGRYKNKEAKVFLEDMERALEHQAQLIVRYEAEEKAQREWEAKLTGNVNCTLDSCEPGNQSDITEERDEIRPESVDPVDMIPSHDQVRSEAEFVCHGEDAVGKPLVNGVVPTVHSEMGSLPDQQQSGSSSSSSMVDEFSPSFSFPSQLKTEIKIGGKEKVECLDHSIHQPLHESSEPYRLQKSSSHAQESFCEGESSVWQNKHQPVRGKEKLECLENSLHQPLHGSSERHPLQKSSSHARESFSEGESSVWQNKPQAVTLQKTKDGLEGVLDALRHAKSSLEHELNRLPLSSQREPMVRATGAPFPAIKASDAMEIPVGCAGLFRVPTDLKFETTPHNSQISLLGPFSDSHLISTRYYPNVGVGGVTSDRYTSRLNLDSGPSSSTQRSYIDPYKDMSMGLPASSRYTYPSYTDLVPRMPSGYGDGIQRQSSLGTAIPSGDQYCSFHDQIRPNMRR
ncbi:uncharacterized protein LOC122080908 [Macadamia integrifolia]|uniref:uncharacterized protein LOC122080908 n=1 Tax=Macadamia integrifolia TaxID=60698 RepID=UPI001C4E420F|nr:uncharacterized protein LOC122080908 [Macadamia integrifolia]XP_042503839.1 uncharacterized protein LOC122080908 [Macadamia integrifolia]XP_042503920.1 uncharacterized protein LOC122080908 [Macadamia integrifolia]